MKHGLVAPQFGVVWQSGAFDPQPSAAPTVIVKRRRWARPADEVPLPASEGDVDAERAPKVYRLEGASAPAAVPATEIDAAPQAAADAPSPLRRRRRDPITRPQLLRHEVFEVEPPPAAGPLGTVPDEGARYDLACRMLQEVRRDLALAQSARRFVESFRLPEETA
jgi:hypothetical protein